MTLSSDGTRAVVGAENDENPNGSEAGSAYLFEHEGGSWTEVTKLAAGDGGDSFGETATLADDGTRAVVGAPDDEDPNGDGAGSAYIFEF